MVVKRYDNPLGIKTNLQSIQDINAEPWQTTLEDCGKELEVAKTPSL